MKKFAIVMVLMLCMILSLGLVACSGSGELATPKNVAINGNTLSWDEVKNASGYVVKLDGKDEVEVQDTSYTYMTDVKGAHTLAVKAKGAGKFTDSKYSENLTFNVKTKLAAPVITMDRDGNKITISWNEIAGADSYDIKIGLNLNETEPIEVKGVTSYSIEVLPKEGEDSPYDDIGEYKISVMAKTNNDQLSNSEWSGQLSYINSKTIATPANFVCENYNFKWESTDEHASKFNVVAVREGDGKEYSNETTGKSLNLNNLRIDEPGKYSVTVYAYNTGDSRIFKDSEKSTPIVIEILPDVKADTFLLSGNTLSWEKVEGASGYTILATTGMNTSTSFNIDIEDGATTNYNLSDSIEFKKADRVGKMFTFTIIAKGKAESLIFDSDETKLAKGKGYQYLQVEKDYTSEANKEALKADYEKVFPKLVEDESGSYYNINSFAGLMWILNNAPNANVKMTGNIDIPSSEFISPCKEFSGTFDGNNYAINNITMTNAFERTNISIFGTLTSKAVVKNLVINGVNIKVDDKKLDSGVIANVNNGTISNVVVDGDVRMLNDSNAGVIVYDNTGTIDGAIVTASIQARSAAGIAVKNSGTVKNSSVFSSVKGVAVDGEVYVGSVVARNSGKISFVVSNTSVLVNTVKEAKRGIVGGIVAVNEANGTIEYTYFTNGVTANCSNIGVVSYAGGFAGINNGSIKLSYVDSPSSIKRQDTTPLAGGFVGQNNGTIANVFSSISVPDSYNENKAAFVADNTNGTITNVAYHQGKSGKAPMTLEGKKGNIDEISRGFESNKMVEAVTVLGEDNFVVYKEFNRNMPVLKNMIYVNNLIVSNVDRNVDLTKSGDAFKQYFFAGETKAVAGEIRTNNYAGYQIIKYTDGDVVYNRLVKVK